MKQPQQTTALYARVSTANQGTGLDAQVRALRDYCSKSGISDYIIYEDENVSGTKDSRPALNRMMKNVEEGKISRVCVYSFSRYARSTTHLLKALEAFKKQNVAFVSITEAIDTNSPLGVAIFCIVGAISQLERDILVERVKNGLAAAKKRGVQLGRKKTRPSKLIRTLRKSGMSYTKIAQVAGCSTGAVATEVQAWKKEQEQGIETIQLDGDIPNMPESKEIKLVEKLETPHAVPELAPLEIVRF